MFKFRTIQANYGDAFLIGYGPDAEPKYLLVDGGPEHTYQSDLRGELLRIAGDGVERLETVILSHVDGDHIVGLLDFFAENAERVANGDDPILEVENVWLNSFAQALDQGSGLQGRLASLQGRVNGMMSPQSALGVNTVGQGNALRRQSLAAGISINAGFPNNLVCVDDAPNPITMDNLKVTVVGPTRANLNELKAKWEAWLDRFEPAFASNDPRLMANADQSVPNLSSIMLHVEGEGKSLLLTGDGRSDHLLDGLDDAGLLNQDGTLHVDVLKVAHHASNRNATKTFHRKVTAGTYVISANGHPDNPDLSTLIWIVETAKEVDREILIRVTNDTSSTQKLLQEYPPADFGYTLEVMPEHWHFWDLDLG